MPAAASKTKKPGVRAARSAARVADVLRRLERQHGRRPWQRRGRALDVFVRAMLSQNTSSGNAAEGWRRLKRDLPSWRRVLDAPPAEVERAIGVCGLGRQRTRRLKAILSRLVAERGRPTLNFLGACDAADAMAYLTGFEGVGPKTAAVTLLFAFDAPVFPVDKGIHRVFRRLGLVARKADESTVRRVVERACAARPGRLYPLHVLTYRHAKEVCRAKNPLCPDCRLLPVCPHGALRVRHHVAGDAAPPPRLARRIGAGIRRRGVTTTDSPPA